MTLRKNNFKLWLPIDQIEKSETGKDGKKVMRLGGIASTSSKDTDGQNLIPDGFDISYLTKRGFVNWNHNKNPDGYIGEPSKAEIRKGDLYVEVDLYPDSDLAKKVYKLAEVLKKNSSKRRLGFSIEGKALELDPLNPNKVTKAMITGLAITPSPKNITSIIDIIKGETDWRNDTEENFEEIVVTPDDIEIKKSSTTEENFELIPEDVDEDLKVINDEDKKKEKTLTKGEVFDRIFELQPVITLEKANIFYEKIKQFAMATKTKKLTGELLEKAVDTLGLNKALGEDEKTKGGKTENLKKAKAKKKENDEEEEETEDLEKGIEDENEEVEEEKELEKGLEDEEDEEEEEKPVVKKNLKKSLNNKEIKGGDNSVAIIKAISHSHSQNQKSLQAVGILIKGLMDEISELKEENELIKGQLSDINGLVDSASNKIDELNFAPVQRKSAVKAIGRPFEKSMDANGNEVQNQGNQNVISISRQKHKLLDVLDKMVFEKGNFDGALAEDLQRAEIGGTISQYGLEKLREKGFNIVN